MVKLSFFVLFYFGHVVFRYGYGGPGTDSHAMAAEEAVALGLCFSVFQNDVMGYAVLYAFSAADAEIFSMVTILFSSFCPLYL